MGPSTTRAIAVVCAVAGAAFAWPAAGLAQTPVLLAAADVAACAGDGDELTAQILDVNPGTIAVVGDISQTNGSIESYLNCYDPTWGRHKDRTRPVPGNHDYRTAGAAAYYSYFGDLAGPAGLGYYSYDLGDWHIVALNSNCAFVSCAEGSAQEQWLRADLAAHPSACTLAYWHHARFSSGRSPQIEWTAPFWDALYEAGAELVLAGHDHIYERFAPQTPSGDPNPAFGIREFIVGTGGYGHSDLEPVPFPNSEARDNEAFGVLRLELEPSGYSWAFLPAAGGTLSDSGSGACHDPQADTTRPSSSLNLPTPNAIVRGLETVAAEAADATRVDFLLGQTLIATDSEPPFALQWDTTAFGDGVRTLTARAVDAAGNGRSDSQQVVIDNGLPATTIVKGPTGVVGTKQQVVYFQSEPGATFSCSLNGRPFKSCSSPAVYPGLPTGRYVFAVRARDAAGNLAPKAATGTWRVDHKAPETIFALRRVARVRPGRATFGFRANETATFRCSLDGAPWAPCTSSVRYPKLRLGRHTFRVRAVDRVGNTDRTPASFTWRVLRRKPAPAK